MSQADSIFALASGAAPAALALWRLSGDGVKETLSALASPLPPPRRAALRVLRDPESGAVLDQAMVLWLPRPRSFTGEDMAEISCHGSPAVIEALSAVLVRNGAFRPARPGEFARRAYLNGKLDLTQAEAIADLALARSQGMREQALRQLRGDASRQMAAWREETIGSLAALEAAIDFTDDDVPESIHAQALARLGALENDLRRHLDSRHGERLRDGQSVLLFGPPNAGKSSLMNALLGRDAAIVHETPGTTRDVVESVLAHRGREATLMDTAGAREKTDHPVEREGQRRARARLKTADCILFLLSADSASPRASWLREWGDASPRPRLVPVAGKSDLDGHGAFLKTVRSWCSQ